ncbi:serine/threonine protein phosphatase [Acidisoma cellulosilytica]|uniref:Serine/threonine protein phosphatase n=1 Tax=Acidisoma cellulosilyticum TaxID=2802395 RepID=A0A963Z4S8_9PROT|nr:metallophosphoesterase family protein [Acidisoma cellulosilyticum]MCB8882814.1 serine/threonine protein phosphatase [Acidisoma cellulosilyticum]
MKLVFQPAPGQLPAGQRIYAIGDVHGCVAAHAAILDQIAEDYAARPVAQAVVIHMGDLIDRGPDSATVLERISRGSPIGGDFINLRGNHEELCLAAFAQGGEVAASWRRNGGETCLADWGVPLKAPSEDWARYVPPAQMAVMLGERIFFRAGGYFFAHAGVRPGVPLAEQDPHDMVWIREPFLSWPGRLEAVVVHGHTPKDQPEIRAHRIGIDTGAVYGGRLTAVVLEEDRLAFMQAPGPRRGR